jgi:hypothetical protein
MKSYVFSNANFMVRNLVLLIGLSGCGVASKSLGAIELPAIPKPASVSGSHTHPLAPSAPDEVEALECKPGVQVRGSVQSSDGAYELDLSRLAVNASMTHKVDIDSFEDRCINTVTLLLEDEPGCVVELTLSADGGSKTLKLSKARFQADSYCQNWPDDLEGTYRMTKGGRFNVSPMLIDERTVDRACTEHVVEGQFSLLRPGSERKILNVSIEASGLFSSLGSVDNNYVCPGIVEERQIGLEMFVGAGGTILPGVGESSDKWEYDSPLLGNLDLGFRIGTRWFYQGQVGSINGSSMVNPDDWSGLNGSHLDGSVGYRFRSKESLKLPVTVGFRYSKLRFTNNKTDDVAAFEYDEGYDYEYDYEYDDDYEYYINSNDKVLEINILNWIVGVHPTYQFSEFKGWNTSGFVSLNILDGEYQALLGFSLSRALRFSGRGPDDR